MFEIGKEKLVESRFATFSSAHILEEASKCHDLLACLAGRLAGLTTYKRSREREKIGAKEQ